MSAKKKDTGGVRAETKMKCQTARSGVQCKREGKWLILGWPGRMLVCGVCHNVIKRLRDRREREQKAKGAAA